MSDINPAYATLIQRRHPEYESRLEHWNFLESCYEGGRDWFKVNIFKYMKEGDTEYADRLKRAYRFNHSREVVDLLDKYLFRAKIARKDEDAEESVQRFWESASRSGAPIDTLVKKASKSTSTFGRTYVVVDSTNVNSSAISVADAIKIDARCYAYIVKPQDALDMSFDDKGQLNWILLREYARDDANPFEAASPPYERYRLWDRLGWKLYRQMPNAAKTTPNVATAPSAELKIELVSQGTHGLNVVPVIPLDHIEDDNLYFTPALINDIAYLDRAVANYLSNLDAIIQDQTFSQLVIPAQALPPGEESSVKDKMVEMGTKRIFTFNGEGGVGPSYISPDPRQAELLITAVRTIINEIYHTVGLAGERTKQDNSMGIDNASGVAKAYDFDRVNALLVAKAESLEKFERRLVKIVCQWNGVVASDEEVDNTVHYSRNFDIRGLMDEFEIAARLALVQAPDSVRREQMVTVVEKLFPAISDEKKDEMMDELETWPESAREMATEAMVPPLDPNKTAPESEDESASATEADSAKRPTQGSVQKDSSGKKKDTAKK